MKKLILIVAAMFLLNVAAVQAQQDTTRTKAPMKDMVEIQATDVPMPIQDALKKDPIYTGWQSGRMYKSKDASRFAIVIGEGDRTKPYYFDAKGKPIKDN